MTLAPSHPKFPSDLDRFLESGLGDGLSTLEIGAAFRLTRFAWRQDPPCSLPGEDPSLAMVAGVTDEEWLRMRPRLLLALAATGSIPGGRLLLEHARRAYDELAAKAAAISRQRSIAGRGNARTADGPSTGRQRAVDEPSTNRLAAPSLRSSPIPTPTLRRSSLQSADLSAKSERPSQEDVVAVLGEGARAILTEKVSAWRREQSLRLLQEAISAWRAQGLTTCPVQKASELASGKHAEPARVEYLIEEANGLIAAEEANGRVCNPVGYVMHGLGESERSRGKPAVIPIFVVQRWSKRQTDTLRILEAQASIDARLRAARTALESSESRSVPKSHQGV